MMATSLAPVSEANSPALSASEESAGGAHETVVVDSKTSTEDERAR
jgi:hypothetical protein